MRRCARTRTSLACALFLAQITTVRAAELKIFSSRAVATVLAEIGPKFQAASGHTLKVIVDLTPTLVRRVRTGEPVDVIVALPALIDSLVQEGYAIADTRTNLVHSGLGLEVRAGALKPDISSVDAFKRALLGLRSIGYLKTPAGRHLDRELSRLGIADDIRKKAVRPDTDIVSELVAKGEIEAGIVVITQIVTSPGVEMVAPLPDELQYYVSFVGAVSTQSKAQGAARDLLKFLTGPLSIPVIKSQGMAPG